MHYPGLIFASFVVALGLAAPGAAVASPPDASVDKTDADRAAIAEALFQQGRRLMTAGRFPEACAKFSESERIDHGVGTLLNLADCYEQNGQIASAWAEFRRAAAAARAEGQAERERIARERERELQPLVAKITIVMRREHLVPGLVVKQDERVLDKSLLGTAIPMDPGEHRLEVSAPGKRPYTRTIRVPKWGGASVTATVPALEDLPKASISAPAPAPVPEPHLSGRRIAAFSLGGLGIAGLFVGSALGVHAIAKDDRSSLHCQGDLCDAEGVDMRTEARRMGTASTVVFMVAGATLVGGAALYLTAPTQGRVTASAGIGIMPAGSGLFVGATW
jgi:serine/threonine-protein kinase